MWRLNISGPDENQRSVTIDSAELTLGRRLDNDLVLVDSAISRLHARIEYRADSDLLVIQDLDSANGTRVNQRRIQPRESCALAHGDRIQIGLHVMTVNHCGEGGSTDSVSGPKSWFSTTGPATESLDPRTDLMYQVAHRLNTITDPQSALVQVSALIRESLHATHCAVVFAGDWSEMALSPLIRHVIDEAARRRRAVAYPAFLDKDSPPLRDTLDQGPICAALCVPVMRRGGLDALIYLDREGCGADLFSTADLELIEAVSHMVALTIERLSMSERIGEEQRLRSLLQSYLPPARVEDLLQNYLRTGRLPGLAEQQATVLFADIADSTKMAERMGARLFGESLQRYYEDMTQIVSDHDGFLEKYLGDGVMAVFGMADGNSRPEDCAVRAGLAMLDFVESNYDLDQDGIQIGVGINSGPVVAGYVRTRDRVDFTILGDTVNVAHGLQSLARPNRLLIGPATCAIVAGRFSIRDLGMTLLKGREEPLQVHEVLRDAKRTTSNLSGTEPVCSRLASPHLSPG
jgi:adenylate cyclase